MKPAQIVLLLVALLAGGLAAFLATRGGDGPAPSAPAEVAEAPKTQVLVAAAPIGVAERLSATNVEWQDWPESALRSDYVTISAMPNAPSDLAGTVARFEIFPGEPIREAKLVHADQGYLSAVLEKGKRGVSIPVSPASSSGGFIVPNDRVDVLLTHSSSNGQVSETILSNVKVLAIGQRLGERGATGAPADPEDPKAEVFVDQTIATLELDPGQGEVLVNATSLGTLSLALRSVADFNEYGAARRPTNQPVQVIRYGKEASVVTNSTSASALAESAPDDFAEPIQIRPSVAITSPNRVTPPPPPPPAPAQ